MSYEKIYFSDNSSETDNTSLKNRFFGVAIVIGIVASWVSSGEFINYSEQHMDYNKSFLLVYLLDAWNILILPLYCLFSLIFWLIKEGEFRNPLQKIRKHLKNDNLTFRKISITAAVSTCNQVIADYGYFKAMGMTTASSGIVIFNLSSIFAYVLSFFLLDEKLLVVKGISVLLAFGGVAAITFSDQQNMAPNGVSEPWIGDLIMAGSALFWALYLVCFKKFVGTPSFATINLQATLVGLFNIIFLWPIIILFHYTHVETFELPNSLTLGFILASTGLCFINNYLFMFGTAVTTPVFVTIGGMLAIPVSTIVDWLFFQSPMSAWKIIGTVIVAVAFLLVNLEFELTLSNIKRYISGEKQLMY